VGLADHLFCVNLIEFTETTAGLTFKVRVVPRASRSEMVGEYDGALRVRLAAAPVENAANEELIRLLSRIFKVNRKAIEIKGGHASKLKYVSVSGMGSQALLDLVARTK
jgi:uncharacterized protein (TIGR00251 family)